MTNEELTNLYHMLTDLETDYTLTPSELMNIVRIKNLVRTKSINQQEVK